MIDENDDGKLSVGELENFFNDKKTGSDKNMFGQDFAAIVMKEADFDKNNEIDFKEFKKSINQFMVGSTFSAIEIPSKYNQ